MIHSGKDYGFPSDNVSAGAVSHVILTVPKYEELQDDTEEAIRILKTEFLNKDFRSAKEAIDWLAEHLKMHSTKNDKNGKGSYYRAFLVKGDLIALLRISRHFSIKDTLERNTHWDTDFVFHIIVDKKRNLSHKKIVDSDEKIKGFENKVCKIPMKDGKLDKESLRKTVDALVGLLTDGRLQESLAGENGGLPVFEEFLAMKSMSDSL